MNVVEPIRDKSKIQAIKDELRKSNIRDFVLFTLGINSGLRVSDLLSLKVLDVLNGDGTVKDRVSLSEKKTGKRKDFPLCDAAKLAISEYVSRISDDPLFRSRRGGPITRVQAYRVLNDAAEKVGITDRIGTHTLRKTFAYQAYQSGWDITMIQKLLNHSSPGVTLRYIGVTQDQMDEVYLGLNL